MVRNFERFQRHLKSDLAGPLPGAKAQFSMAPVPRSNAAHSDIAPPGAQVSGVMILLYPRDEQLYLPLIRRSEYQGVHSGQISLPGGRIEACDTDVVETALRETEEEIGVPSSSVRVLGQLSPLYIGASNNIVYPSVGSVDEQPSYRTDVREVAALIETPLLALLAEDSVHREVHSLRGRQVEIPFFLVDDQMVWGATAMILGEFLALRSIESLHKQTIE